MTHIIATQWDCMFFMAVLSPQHPTLRELVASDSPAEHPLNCVQHLRHTSGWLFTITGPKSCDCCFVNQHWWVVLVGAKVKISSDSLLWSWSVNPQGQALHVTDWYTGEHGRGSNSGFNQGTKQMLPLLSKRVSVCDSGAFDTISPSGLNLQQQHPLC